jgi:hypothetical protein
VIPQSTQNVIHCSDFYFKADVFYFVDALHVKTPELRRLICRDDEDITVVTNAAGLPDLTI